MPKRKKWNFRHPQALNSYFPLVRLRHYLDPKFFCECYVLLYPYQTYKLASRSARCVFIRYSKHTEGFKFNNPSRIKVT